MGMPINSYTVLRTLALGGELYEQEGVSNMVEYLRDNFDPKEPLATHHYTCREMLDQMRECTPIGIMVYSVLAATPEVFDE